MAIKNYLFGKIHDLAVAKLPNHPELCAYPHFSFIIQNDKIIGYSTNNSHEPPRHYGYHNLRTDKSFKPKFHSEIASYHKVRGILVKSKPFQIVNVRLNKDGELKLSKPCSSCYNLLKSLGCSQFYFSSECGFLQLK